MPQSFASLHVHIVFSTKSRVPLILGECTNTCPPEVAEQNLACYNAKFSPDGRYVAAGLTHPQFAVCIWDLQAAEASTGESGSWSGSSLPTPNQTPQGGTVPASPRRQARQRNRR